jgi:hypothetical protein
LYAREIKSLSAMKIYSALAPSTLGPTLGISPLWACATSFAMSIAAGFTDATSKVGFV